MRFGQRSDHQIQPFDCLRVVAIDLLESTKLLGIVSQILEAAKRIEAKLPAKFVVAWEAELAGSEDVDGCQVEQWVAWKAQSLHEPREVVQHELTGMLVAERV